MDVYANGKTMLFIDLHWLISQTLVAQCKYPQPVNPLLWLVGVGAVSPKNISEPKMGQSAFTLLVFFTLVTCLKHVAADDGKTISANQLMAILATIPEAGKT